MQKIVIIFELIKQEKQKQKVLFSSRWLSFPVFSWENNEDKNSLIKSLNPLNMFRWRVSKSKSSIFLPRYLAL